MKKINSLWLLLLITPGLQDSAGITIATHAHKSLEVLTEQLSRFFDKRIHWVIYPEKYMEAAIHRAFAFYPS